MATGLRMEAAIFQIVAIFPDFEIVGRGHDCIRLHAFDLIMGGCG